jgi:hypothetical protein
MPQDAEDFEQPITFASQQTAAANAREVASQQGAATLAEVETQVPANSEVLVPDAQAQLQLPAILESVSMYSIEPHADATYVEFQIDVDGDGTIDTTPLITPRIATESFDPGALAPPTATIDIRLVNNSGSATTLGAQALFREI